MSVKLFEFAMAFVNGNMSADEFADKYIELWRQERSGCLLKLDERSLSLALSTTFVMVDNYNPDAERKDYEFDEAQLRQEVAKVLATVRR